MLVLLAEDNDVIQVLVKKMLHKMGWSVAIVNNGREALDYLASPPEVCPRPDIILMDLAMPVMNGLLAASIIRSEMPFINDLKIRMTSIIGLDPRLYPRPLEAFIPYGLDDVFGKTWNLPLLRQLLLQHSRHGPVPVGPGASRMTMAPVWGPMPLRKFRGPRSRL